MFPESLRVRKAQKILDVFEELRDIFGKTKEKEREEWFQQFRPGRNFSGYFVESIWLAPKPRFWVLRFRVCFGALLEENTLTFFSLLTLDLLAFCSCARNSFFIFECFALLSRGFRGLI